MNLREMLSRGSNLKLVVYNINLLIWHSQRTGLHGLKTVFVKGYWEGVPKRQSTKDRLFEEEWISENCSVHKAVVT